MCKCHNSFFGDLQTTFWQLHFMESYGGIYTSWSEEHWMILAQFAVFWLVQQNSNSLFPIATTLHGNSEEIPGTHPFHKGYMQPLCTPKTANCTPTFPFHMDLMHPCESHILLRVVYNPHTSKSNSTRSCMWSPCKPHASLFCKGLCANPGKPHSTGVVCNPMQATFTQGIVCNLYGSPLP